jgi:hypothetical protein
MSDQQLYKAEDGAALRFYTKPIKNNFQSEKHGRMIFDTGLFVEVITPGSTESLPEFLCETTFCDEMNIPPKRTDYYLRFRQQIEAYKEQTGAYALSGLPLTEWTQIDVGTAATLRACGVHTVEQLAEVSDSNLHNLGIGGRTLREKAKGWLTSRDFGIPSAQMSTQLSELRVENERLLAENQAIKAQLAARPETPAPEPAEFGNFAAAEALSAPVAPPHPPPTFLPV